MAYRWKPSKAAVQEFKTKMDDIAAFCEENDISQSARGDSYYFRLNGTDYRVSNHTVEASNARARNEFGEQIREMYHPEGHGNTVQIFAGKTRIIEIYNDLKAGYQLDGHGNRK